YRSLLTASTKHHTLSLHDALPIWLAGLLRDAYAEGTGMDPADYIAEEGLDERTDLGGLNLSTVPKVFLEAGNMRNPGDAKRLEDGEWRERAADAITGAVVDFLTGAEGDRP